jgi:hypothetical protein
MRSQFFQFPNFPKSLRGIRFEDFVYQGTWRRQEEVMPFLSYLRGIAPCLLVPETFAFYGFAP